jgi:hypothetical protein
VAEGKKEAEPASVAVAEGKKPKPPAAKAPAKKPRAAAAPDVSGASE